MKTFTKNLFKVLILMMISMTLMVTAGCDDDDDLPTIDEMVGVWSLYEIEADDGTITPFAQLDRTIVITFTENAFTYVETRTGETPENGSGTWVRVNATSITITTTGDTESMTLTKDGEYYVYHDNHSGDMKYKKQL